jgi:hypothetical protein
MRLGELLIAANVLTGDQVDEALRAQVMWGARLGTSLVELGYIDLDGVSNALGYQSGLPAALASHFDRADRELQRQLAPNHAERFACIPLMRVGKRAVAVAVATPLDERALAIIADELGVAPDRVIVSIAPELRVRYALEYVYQIPRPQRFLRAPGSPRAMPAQVVLPGRPPAAVLEPPPLPVVARTDTGERRRYVQDVNDSGPMAALPQRDRSGGVTVDPATLLARIEAAADREQLARYTTVAVDRMEPLTEVAVVLALRCAVTASMTTFHRDAIELPSIAIPTGLPSVVAAALRVKRLVQATVDKQTDLDKKLLAAVGLREVTLLATPVLAHGRVVAVLVIATQGLGDPEVINAIAAAAGKGLERLMRQAID